MERRARTFETPKEPLGHRIVQAIALTAQTTTDAGFREPCLIGTTRLVTSAICMVDEPHRGLTTPQRHPQRVLYEGRLSSMTQRPAHHVAGREIQSYRQGQPPLGRP
jgi:hypothetical protein